MGRYDSSRTRVTPVFDALLARDPTSQSWLPTLLALPEGVGTIPTPIVPAPGLLTSWGSGTQERSLPPPRSLLRWLVQQATLPIDAVARDTGETRARREALIRRDPATIAEALARLSRPRLPARAWYILEGPSRPDVYLETPELLVVIEGKRTEAGPTTYTTWMPGRHQMLRHLDAAWELRGGRALAGFFIVEGAGSAEDLAVPPLWQAAAQTTVSPQALASSLPHRSPEEQQAIATAFLGVATWQHVCAALGLNYARLPNT